MQDALGERANHKMSKYKAKIFFLLVVDIDFLYVIPPHLSTRPHLFIAKKILEACSMVNHDYHWLHTMTILYIHTVSHKTRKDRVFQNGNCTHYYILCAHALFTMAKRFRKNTDKCSLHCQVLMLTSFSVFTLDKRNVYEWTVCHNDGISVGCKQMMRMEQNRWKKKKRHVRFPFAST